VALAQNGVTVTYNLFATDGYVTLADGTVAYIYGFVGGRDNVPLTYQTSTAKGAGSMLPSLEAQRLRTRPPAQLWATSCSWRAMPSSRPR